MDREILFRGKCINSNEWVYGNLIETQDEVETEYAILEKTAEHRYGGEYGDSGWYRVIPETTGQFTGLIDKNGVKIFEGDILQGCSCGEKVILGVVEYGTGTFDSGIYRYTGFYYRTESRSADHTNLYQKTIDEYDKIEVIGNIYDNQELLAEKP